MANKSQREKLLKLEKSLSEYRFFGIFMRKIGRYTILLMFLLWGEGISLYAQIDNLVPNGNFDTHTWCPGGRGLLGWAVPWYSPNRNTSDFCHLCSGSPSYSGVPDNRWGFQWPYDGDGYAGIRTWISTKVFIAGKNYREYLAVQLLDTLRGGDTYFLSFKVSVGDNAGFFSDDIGMYLSRDTIASDTILLFEPHLANPQGNVLTDMNEWVEISGQYIATGGENFLVIGNFLVDEETTLIPRENNDSLFQTTYFFIDDVRVEPCKARFPESLVFAEDSLICPGETIRLAGAELEGASYEWEDGSTNVIRQVQQAGMYEISISLNGCTRRESIRIDAVEIPEIELGADTLLCPGQTLLLEGPPGADSYLWNDQSTDPDFWVTEAGSYRLTVKQGKCSLLDEIVVEYETIPSTPEDQSFVKCTDENLELQPDIPGRTYTWQDLTQGETYMARAAGTYWVDVSSLCYQLQQTFFVEEELCSCSSTIPNVFSPNSDGFNDLFVPRFEAGPTQYQLDIFDRFGRRMFRTNNPQMAWDGTLNKKRVPEGVYYWVLEYTCLESGESQQRIKSGELSLLR